jgi:hypothetical protein
VKGRLTAPVLNYLLGEQQQLRRKAQNERQPALNWYYNHLILILQRDSTALLEHIEASKIVICFASFLPQKTNCQNK